jgi:hypothetical protein
LDFPRTLARVLPPLTRSACLLALLPLQEASMLWQLSHPHIVQFFGVALDGERWLALPARGSTSWVPCRAAALRCTALRAAGFGAAVWLALAARARVPAM